MSERPTPEERLRAWAERESIEEAELGNIPADQIDRYADLVAGSFVGQGMALNFALDDLKHVLLTDRHFHAYLAIMWLVIIGVAFVLTVLL